MTSGEPDWRAVAEALAAKARVDLRPVKHCHWTKHKWEDCGTAEDFQGQPCRLWRCSVCGDERELFAFVGPPPTTRRR